MEAKQRISDILGVNKCVNNVEVQKEIPQSPGPRRLFYLILCMAVFGVVYQYHFSAVVSLVKHVVTVLLIILI